MTALLLSFESDLCGFRSTGCVANKITGKRNPGREVRIMKLASYGIAKTLGSALRALAVVAGIVGLVGGAHTASAENKEVKIGLAAYQDLLSLTIAKEMGWDLEEGLDFVFIETEWREGHEFLASGAVDFTSSCDGDEVSRAEKIPDIALSNLLYLFAAHGVAVRGDSGMKTYWEYRGEGLGKKEAITATMAQLKGSTIILTKGLGMDAALKKAAEEAGLTYPDDFELIDMSHFEGLAAFLGGSGDGYIGGIPQRLRAGKEGAKILFDESIYAESVLHCGLATRLGYIEANPEVPIKIQKIMFRILQYVERNPREALTHIVDEVNKRTAANMTYEELHAAWNEMEFFPSNARWAFTTAVSPEGAQYWRAGLEFRMNTYLADGTLKNPVDLTSVYHVPEVLAEYMQQHEPGTYAWTFGIAKRRFQGRPDEFKKVYGLDY